MKNIVERLASNGFKGFVSIKDLKENFPYSGIPREEGVYHVLRLKDSAPEFLKQGTGGYFKGKEPNVAVDVLLQNWVDAEPIVYIGKATDLYHRIRQYMQFGSGKAIGHFGGRYIWQLADSDDLIVCWKCVRESRSIEKAMIADFKNDHNGKRPFANLKD